LKLPVVDAYPASQGVTPSVAVWSYASTSISAGNLMTYYFPWDTQVPNPIDLTTYPYVFIRYTDTSGNFASTEITVTAGSYVAPNGIQITLPVAIGQGSYYVRFDQYIQDSSGNGLKMTTWPSVSEGANETLVLQDHNGVKTASMPFYLAPPDGSSQNLCDLSGRIVSSLDTSKGLPGALVFLATSDSTPLNSPYGPRASTVAPLGLTTNAYTAVTDFDGYYSFKVPCDSVGTTYQLYGTVAGQNSSGVQTILPSGSPTVVSYTLTSGSGTTTAANLQFALPR
jgi:hypothetical protein